MNTEKKIINKVKTLLGLEVKLEQMKLDNGAVLEADAFEVGAEVFVVADEERVAVPIGEYVMEDGKSLKVVEEGIIAEIGEASTEEEAPAEEVVEEEELATEAAAPKKIVKSISEEMFFSEIEKLRNEISELKLSKVEEVVVEEVVELSSQEEVEGISHNPENATAKRELHLYAQKGKNTIQDRIFNTINK
tara:strand:- start:29 stop:601 length:573 start_codon:yes stop_codon:yes gene_type:complete